MVTGLCQMLSPILAFTADEAWEFIPKTGLESVHLSTWKPSDFVLPEAEQDTWKKLLEYRELILPYLEKERQAKTIGKALEAKITLSGQAKGLLDLAPDNAELLRELLNVSQLTFGALGKDSGPFAVTISRADGQKCERCWHWESTVGTHAAHPGLCARCVTAVEK